MSKLPAPVRHEEILAVATELIQKGGAAALTMGALANSVGVSRPTIYQYFPSREHVFGEILVNEMADLSNELDRLLSGLEDPLEQVRIWIHFSLAFMASERHRIVQMISVAELPPEQSGMLRAMHGFFTTSLIAPLSALGTKEPTSLCNLILGSVGAAAQRIEKGTEYTIEAQALERFVMAGIDAARGASIS
ncbi:MAG: TetR/AcrR family transcriptional regulator [Micrococcales bacterium]